MKLKTTIWAHDQEVTEVLDEMGAKVIPPEPGRPRWAGRPERVDPRVLEIEVEHEATLDLEG